MAGYEVRVEVGFNDMPDDASLRAGLLQIDIRIPLRIDHRGLSARRDAIRGMGQAAQIELAEVHMQ